MHRTSRTFKKNKIYSPSSSVDERSRYSESKKQIKVRSNSKKTISAWVAYRKIRNKIKQKINTTKTSFYKNILNSNNMKDTWKVIHCILNPQITAVEGILNYMHKYFNSTAARITSKEPVKTSEIYSTITSLSEVSTTEQFEPQTTNSDEVLKIMKSLCNDCSTGYCSHVPEYFSLHIRFIINSQILIRTLSKKWKIARMSPNSKS